MPTPIWLTFLLPLSLIVLSLLGAVVVRFAINRFNPWVGGPQSPRAVPEPTFARAIVIALGTLLGLLFVNVVLDRLHAAGLVDSSDANPSITKWIWPISLPLTTPINTVLNWRLLPTTLFRALGVTVYCVAVLIMILFGSIFFGFMGAALLKTLFPSFNVSGS